MLAKSGKVFGCWIAFVFRKSVSRVKPVEFVHEPIARDFRQNARGGDTEALRIPANERCLRRWESRHRKSVDERMSRRGL